MRGDVRLFHYLIDNDPAESLLAVNRWGNSLLHLTVSGHRHLLTEICLTHTRIPINLQNRSGETAFLKAVKGGDMSTARRLMKAGCDINMADKNGFHPLTAALRHMKQNDETLLSFIRDLLVGGVDPDMCNYWGGNSLVPRCQTTVAVSR